MIYLRKFNENSNIEEDLQSLFSDLLVRLIDEDFNIDVKKYHPKSKFKHSVENVENAYRIKITKGKLNIFSGKYEDFYWYDIRDYFIPFIKFMNNDYTLLNIHLDTHPSSIVGSLLVNEDDIINDKIIDYRLVEIYITFQVSL